MATKKTQLSGKKTVSEKNLNVKSRAKSTAGKSVRKKSLVKRTESAFSKSAKAISASVITQTAVNMFKEIRQGHLSPNTKRVIAMGVGLAFQTGIKIADALVKQAAARRKQKTAAKKTTAKKGAAKAVVTAERGVAPETVFAKGKRGSSERRRLALKESRITGHTGEAQKAQHRSSYSRTAHS